MRKKRPGTYAVLATHYYDDPTHLVGLDFRRDLGRCQRGWHRVRLVLTDQEVKF